MDGGAVRRPRPARSSPAAATFRADMPANTRPAAARARAGYRRAEQSGRRGAGRPRARARPHRRSGLTPSPGRRPRSRPRPPRSSPCRRPRLASTYATVEAWARQADGRYRRVARVPLRAGGVAGRRRDEREPLPHAGRCVPDQPAVRDLKPNPGVAGVSYLRVDRNDVWTGSRGSVINQHRRCAPGTCPASYGAIERLSNYPGPYDYGFFIGYNAPRPTGPARLRAAGRPSSSTSRTPRPREAAWRSRPTS